MAHARREEIDSNYQYFQSCVSAYLPNDKGKFALLRHNKVIEVYQTLIEAVNAGNTQFADEVFSIQEVTDTALDLGFFSHAHPIG